MDIYRFNGIRGTWGTWGMVLCQLSQNLHMQLVISDTHRGTSVLSFLTMVLCSSFFISSHCSLSLWGKKSEVKWKCAPKIFSPFVWIVAHFFVMGNKMWFQACWRTWMIPVQNLEARVPDPTFYFSSLIWITDGFSKASFHLPLNSIYNWQCTVFKLVVDLKIYHAFRSLAGSWAWQFS